MLVSLFALFLFAFALWGWGNLAGRLCGGSGEGEIAYPMTLGLAVLAAVGGVLNAISVAVPASIWAVLGTGWVLALVSLRQFLRKADIDANGWIAGAVSLGMLIFLVATLMPSTNFNYHDDFHTYFARPFRMLETGTVSGGWFDLLGLDSLGAQAFFQGVLLSMLSPAHMFAFDSVFCMALSVALTGPIARQLGVHPLVTVGAAAAVVLVNPMTVNVSAVYAGVAASLGLVLATLRWTAERGEGLPAGSWRRAVPIGMFLALLVALKATLAMYGALFFLLWIATAYWPAGARSGLPRSFAAAGGAALLALLPWFLLHGRNYLAALSRDVGLASSEEGPAALGIRALWSAKDLSYGGSILCYNLLVAMLLGVAAIAGYRCWKGRWRAPAVTGEAGVFVAVTVAAAGEYLINPYLTDVATAIRYACPMLISAAAVGTVAASHIACGWRDGTVAPGGFSRRVLAAGLLVPMCVLLLFAGPFATRVAHALEWRTPVSFPLNRMDAQYNQFALSPETGEEDRRGQYRIPRGETVLAWVARPFVLDFKRNRIWTPSEPALLTPWATLPLRRSTEEMRAYLVERGVRYIMWETVGWGMRNPAELRSWLTRPDPLYRRLGREELAWLGHMRNMAMTSPLLYEAEGMIVMDLTATDAGKLSKSIGAPDVR